MEIKNKNKLSRDEVRKFLALYEPEKKQAELEGFSSMDFLRMQVLYEEFKRQKENLIRITKEIRNLTRKDQAKVLKENYGTRSVKAKIAFRIIDSPCKEALSEEENEDLFLFCSKFLT